MYKLFVTGSTVPGIQYEASLWKAYYLYTYSEQLHPSVLTTYYIIEYACSCISYMPTIIKAYNTGKHYVD